MFLPFLISLVFLASLTSVARADPYYTSSEKTILKIWQTIDHLMLELEPSSKEAEYVGCLAMNDFYEASGSRLLDRIRIMQVIENRAKQGGYYPSDLCKVIYQQAPFSQTCEFSWVCYKKKPYIPKSSLARSVDLSHLFVRWRFLLPDFTKGALFYISKPGKIKHLGIRKPKVLLTSNQFTYATSEVFVK